jgi:2-methylisocitrate lyase-like PEP mutase family enzyme
MTQREKAELLLRLQQPGSSLLLPNAWDAASARLFEEAGFPAIGTTSAGIAYAQGYPDGEQMERDEMLQAITRIASIVQVPVTDDMPTSCATSCDVNDRKAPVFARKGNEKDWRSKLALGGVRG